MSFTVSTFEHLLHARKLWLRLSLIVTIKSLIDGKFTFENAQTPIPECPSSLTKISVKSSPKIRVTKNLPAQQLCNFINISISPNVIQAKTKITAVAFIRKILQTEFRTLLSQRMTLPRLLSVLVLANALSGVLSCGGSSPPPPCSWQTCRPEWRDDWNPGIITGECVNQRRHAHHAYDTHRGSGSCPAPSPCGPLTQHRKMCKYDSRCRFFFKS